MGRGGGRAVGQEGGLRAPWRELPPSPRPPLARFPGLPLCEPLSVPGTAFV